MSDQSNPGGGTVASPDVYIQPLAEKPPKRSLLTDVDKLADDALAKGAATQRRGPATKGERASAERTVDQLMETNAAGRARDFGTDPDDEPEDERAERKRVREQPEEDDEPAAARQPNGDEAPEPQRESDEGTRKKPYTRDDLPEDRFIEVKVDGQKQVVPLRELVDGYAGQKAIQQRLERIGLEKQAMTREVEGAREEVKKTNDHFRSILNDPDELYALLSHREFEPTLQALAKKRWDDLAQWKANPVTRAEFLRQRDERAFAQQQQRMQQQQQLEQQRATEQAQLEHRTQVIKPGWEEGIRRAGNPDVNHPELIPLASQLIDIATQKQRAPTMEEVASAVARTCKMLGLQPRGAGAPPPKKNINRRPRGQAGLDALRTCRASRRVRTQTT